MTTLNHTASTFISNRFLFWLSGIVLFFAFISSIQGILLPFVVGILLAYFLDPAVRWLHRLHWSRTVAASVITLASFLFIILTITFLTPIIAHQLAALIRSVPDHIHLLEARYGSDAEKLLTQFNPDTVNSIKDAAGTIGTSLFVWIGETTSNIIKSGFAILNILSLFFISPIVVFYLLRDWDIIVKRFNELLPRDNAEVIRQQLLAIDATLAGFIRGQLNVCIILALYYSIALSIFGLNFGLLIGVLTGLFLFVPFVGFATGCIVGTTIAYFQFSDSTHMIEILIIYAVGAFIENALAPRLVGDKVGLHPLWLIFGMLAGGALFGFVGVLISVPVTSVLGVLVRFATSRYLQSTMYRGDHTL